MLSETRQNVLVLQRERAANNDPVMSETPKKAVGRPTKKPSCNNFCCVCGCNFKNYYGDFKTRISTENLFELPKRAGVEKCRLAHLLAEIGFSCEENASFSNRVCTKCSTKIRNTTGLIRFFRCSLLAHAPLSELGCSPIAIFSQTSLCRTKNYSELSFGDILQTPLAVRIQMNGRNSEFVHFIDLLLDDAIER